MTMDEWREQLDRIPGLWSGRKPLSEATMKAWFDELGRFTDRELFDALLSRMAMSADRAPGLAALAMAVRDAGGSRRPKQQDEPESPEDRERWDRVGKDWTLIGACLHDPALAAIYWALMGVADPSSKAQCVAALERGGDADPGDMRLVLLEEIREREIKPQFRKPLVEASGGLVSIGETLGAAA